MEIDSIYIARDKAVVPDDMVHFLERHPEKEYEFGRLHVFYEKPLWKGKEWCGAREICDAKSYMFPEIGCGECACFKFLAMMDIS